MEVLSQLPIFHLSPFIYPLLNSFSVLILLVFIGSALHHVQENRTFEPS